MNMILLQHDDFSDAGKRIILTGRRFEHITTIMKASVGDILRVGLINEKIGDGNIVSINDSEVEMEIKLNSSPPPPLPVTLLLAMPRPKMMKRVLFNAASMGVKKIILINSYRVEKSFWQSTYLKDEKMNEQLILALEQTQDTVLPVIVMKRFFKPFVEDELPEIVKDSVPLVAHPAAENSCPREMKNQVTLAIGPEGGFIPYEIDALIKCGFTPVTIGKRVLRVETAVPAILSHLF